MDKNENVISGLTKLLAKVKKDTKERWTADLYAYTTGDLAAAKKVLNKIGLKETEMESDTNKTPEGRTILWVRGTINDDLRLVVFYEVGDDQ